MSPSTIRPPSQAGAFYPAHPQVLRREVETCINEAPLLLQPDTPPPIGFVSPHAGYAFSGSTAGYTYRQLQALAPEIVFVLAPSHHASFAHPSLWDGPAYATPLGDYPIHSKLADRLRQTIPGACCETWAERQEHALEVQIPFLQVACPNAQLVPLLLGSCSPQSMDEVANGIEQVLREENLTERGRVALVASSDGYHGYHLRECQTSDSQLAKAIERMDRQALYGSTPTGDPMACGRGPIAVVLEVSRRLGATRGMILNQTNSADAVPHSDGQWVVGYVAALFV